MTANKQESEKYVFVHIIGEQRVLVNQIVRMPKAQFEKLDRMLDCHDGLDHKGLADRIEACRIISNEWVDYSDLSDKGDLELDDFSVIEEEKWKQQS